ncbi:MAG: TetR family transcriptional regulator [bacterium]
MPKPQPQIAAPSTRERILAAAARLFAELGFSSASMPAIAEQSGITAGAIYRHFDSKAELLLEVVRHALRSPPVSVRAREHGGFDASTLPEVAASYTATDLKPMRQLSLEVHAAASRDPSVERLLSDWDEDLTRQLREGIELAQRQGLADSSLDPELAARFYAVLIMGLNHMDTLHPSLVGDPAWRRFVAERVAALLGLSTPVE